MERYKIIAKSDLAVALDVAVVELALVNSNVSGSAVRVCSSDNYVGDGQTSSLSESRLLSPSLESVVALSVLASQVRLQDRRYLRRIQ